jgi:hypothetical protein
MSTVARENLIKASNVTGKDQHTHNRSKLVNYYIWRLRLKGGWRSF